MTEERIDQIIELAEALSLDLLTTKDFQAMLMRRYATTNPTRAEVYDAFTEQRVYGEVLFDRLIANFESIEKIVNLLYGKAA